MRQLFRSIRSRITWPVIAVLVICFLFLGSQLLQVREELLESLVITEYVEYFETLINTLHDDKLILLEETIKSMTSNIYFAQLLDHKRATAVSEVLQDVGSNFASSGLAGLIAVDKNNAMVAEYRNKPFDFKASTVPFSAIQHSSEGLNYVAAIPVLWQGENIGAVYGVYSLADVITELQDKTVAEDVFIYSFSDIIYAGTAENDEYAISNTSISEVLAGTVTYELGERGKELRLLLPLRDDEESVVGFIKVIFDIALYQDVFLEATKSVLFTFVGTLLLLAVALQFILGYILKPVKAVVAISGELSKGTLYARVASPTNDEIGSIARAFNNMGESFEAVIINLKHSVSELLSSLQTIALASEQVAAGSQQQAQGTSSILDMSHKIAGAADSISTQAISTTTLVSNIMDSAIDGKQSLAVALQVTNEVEEKVSTLREQSARIAEISALIKDISYQTSLLSLNAAIEAARAGEAGRGFAVVADEVRKLAESTAEATQDIDKLIRSTEEQIARVAESTGELQSANTGVVAQFESIVEGLQSGAAAVQDIAHMVAAQAEFSRQVTIAVESVAAVVEENSAAVEENAGMISEMRKLAQSIGKLTDSFKTKK